MGKKPLVAPNTKSKGKKKKQLVKTVPVTGKNGSRTGKRASATVASGDAVPKSPTRGARAARKATSTTNGATLGSAVSSDTPAPEVRLSPATDSAAAAAAALRWILAPVKTDAFFDTFWEKKPLLVQREKPDYYKNLFSTAELDRILRQDHLQYGRNLDITSFSDGERETHNPAGRAHAAVVWDYFRNGCSVRLLNPQTYSGPVWRLCSTLQEYFGCMVGANVYLTPAGTQGFAPHYDDIEAFLLQLEGQKRWRVYAPRPGEELARDSSGNFRPEDVTDAAVLDVTLRAGDLLYFPRGTIHQGESLPDHHSLHITVSAYQHTAWADLLEKMVPVALQRAIAENVDYRRGLPVGFLGHAGIVNEESQSPQRAALLETARRLVTKLADYLPLDAAVDQLGKQFMHDALPPPLSTDERCRSVHEDGERWTAAGVTGRAVMDGTTEVRLLRGNCVRLVNEADELRLYHCVENSRLYHEIDAQWLDIESDEHAGTVDALIKSYPAFTVVADLPGEDADAKVAFVASLWEKGLLVTRKPTYEESDD